MKEVFIIHSLKLEKEAMEHERSIKKTCYIPGRDTKQTHGDDILRQNLNGMKDCKEVYVIWDNQSMGTLFDMGMAYALGIPIKPIMLAQNRSWVIFFEGKINSTI